MTPGENSSHNLKGYAAVRALDHGHPIFADTKIADDYQKGLEDVVMWGELTYIDVFGVNHWTHFCTVFGNHKNGELIQREHAACSTYNKSDNNQILASKYVPQAAIQPIPQIPCPVKKTN
jgi:hypothetical protein